MLQIVNLVISFIFNNLGAIALFMLFISLFEHIFNSYKQRKSLPAGPSGLPIVGYLPFLGKEPHKDIAKLSKKYGNVLTLPLGIHNVVILNDFEAVKDAFHKDAFLGRPENSPFSLMDKTKSFVDTNGSEWKEHRRLTLQILRDLGFGKGSMEDRIIDEITHLTQHIDQTEGKPTDIHTLLVPSMSNNISHLVFGHRYEYDEPKRKIMDNILDIASPMFSQIGLFATAPVWLSKTIMSVGFVGQKRKIDTFNKLFEVEIENHQKKLNENNIHDYIDGYLVEMEVRKKKDANTSLTLDKLKPNCANIFGAGSETVRTTTEWLLMLSAHYSEHQKRIQQEIDGVIGNERHPTYADRARMPFTQAFINEMFRWKNTLPLNLTRRALEDSEICGHFIPKDTLVIANLWAVHNDPKVWHHPDQFDPNRFLSTDGKELIKTESLIPFSMGKRSCTGETLGRTEIFLYFVSLLQRYTIYPPNGTTISFEDKFGLSLQPKNKPFLIFKKRI